MPSHTHSRHLKPFIPPILLAVILAAGAAFCVRPLMESWRSFHTPFCQEQLKSLQRQLDRLDSAYPSKIEELTNRIDALAQKKRLDAEKLDSLKAERLKIRLQEAVSDSSFDIRALFATDYFDDAYRQYLTDLFEIFLKDPYIHQWLYPYYVYATASVQDPHEADVIRDGLSFYTPDDGDNMFSPITEDPADFMKNCYNFDLYQHIYYTGRIYITASDFLNRVIYVPCTVTDAAIFAKAYGGIPDPAQMNVPDWTQEDYSRFWRYALSGRETDEPVWVIFGLSSEDFNIDWNSLMDEQAFYDTYLKFMNRIAPGLGVFDMVSYSDDNDSYGGMYYEINGKEASATQIAALYLETHPEYIEENLPELDTFSSPLDSQIDSFEKTLEKMDSLEASLLQRRDKLNAMLSDAEDTRQEYEKLTDKIETHNTRVARSFYAAAIIFAICFMGSLVCVFIAFKIIRARRRAKTARLTPPDDQQT